MNTKQQLKKIDKAIIDLSKVKDAIQDDDTSDFFIDSYLYAVEENVDNALDAVTDDSGT